MLTFAQNFEDVMLSRLFQRQAQGFYVDIGAWDPTLHSVTKHFYDMGWSGINIEPIKRQLDLFTEQRPRDRNLAVAVSDVKGHLVFHECSDLTSLSTASPDQAKALKRVGHNLISYEVDVITLRDIAEHCRGHTVDFLKVDVEGLEKRILKGGDWHVFRPRVLVIEATVPARPITDWDNVAAISNWEEWEPILLDSGYVFALYDGLSRFYLRHEDRHLAPRLSLPPGIHDDLHFPEVEKLRVDVAAISEDRREKASVITRLVDENSNVRADRQLKENALERLASENADLREDQQLRAEALKRLATDNASIRKDQQLKAEALERLAIDNVSIRKDQQLKAEALARLATDNASIRRDQQLKAEALERLATDNASLREDQKLKAEAIERLAIDNSSLREDQKLKAEAIERLATENTDLRKDQQLKTEVIERLVNNNASLREDQRLKADAIQRLATDNSELREDQQQKVEAIVRLSTDVANISGELEIRINDVRRATEQLELILPRLSAKDQIIQVFTGRELERKVLLGGVPDVVWHWRRKHAVPTYGDLLPPATLPAGMHVGVDTLEIIFGVSGGVETYMKMLVGALLQSSHRLTLICLPDQLGALQRQFGDRVGYFVVRASRSVQMVQSVRGHLRRPSTRVTASLSLTTFSRLTEDLGIDLLHSPVQIFSVLDFHLPTVLNLHDLQHLHHPENFRPSDIDARNRLYGLSASLADAVVVSSDFVRNDLISKMSVPPAKVFTVPVTWDPVVENGLAALSADAARAHYRLPASYALYPAQFWRHKNHARLVEALRIVRDRRPAVDLKLVFTGYRGHDGWPEVEATIRRLGLVEDVICLDHVPTEHLAGLYRGAMFCVMPSTFEASSYPVIEAQVLGVPVMCSNVTSLPELMTDGAGLLFDPYDPDDIAAKMLRWLDDASDRKTHAARGAVRARRVHSLQNYVDGLGRVYQFALGKTH